MDIAEGKAGVRPAGDDVNAPVEHRRAQSPADLWPQSPANAGQCPCSPTAACRPRPGGWGVDQALRAKHAAGISTGRARIGVSRSSGPLRSHRAATIHSALLRRFDVETGICPRYVVTSTFGALRLPGLMLGKGFVLLEELTTVLAPVFVRRHGFLPTSLC
jgi:hypothetical protein